MEAVARAVPLQEAPPRQPLQRRHDLPGWAAREERGVVHRDRVRDERRSLEELAVGLRQLVEPCGDRSVQGERQITRSAVPRPRQLDDEQRVAAGALRGPVVSGPGARRERPSVLGWQRAERYDEAVGVGRGRVLELGTRGRHDEEPSRTAGEAPHEPLELRLGPLQVLHAYEHSLIAAERREVRTPRAGDLLLALRRMQREQPRLDAQARAVLQAPTRRSGSTAASRTRRRCARRVSGMAGSAAWRSCAGGVPLPVSVPG